MKKFGVDAAKCTLMAVASGLIGLCGATIMYWASAIAAIFFIVSTPPQTADIRLHEISAPDAQSVA